MLLILNKNMVRFQYQISRRDCNAVYVTETGGSDRTRIQEHVPVF